MSVSIEVTTDTEAISVSTGNVTNVSVSDPSGYSESNVKDIARNISSTGQVTLSNGKAIEKTGISDTDATYLISLGTKQLSVNCDFDARLFWDNSAGEYKLKIFATASAPTINYDILKMD